MFKTNLAVMRSLAELQQKLQEHQGEGGGACLFAPPTAAEITAALEQQTVADPLASMAKAVEAASQRVSSPSYADPRPRVAALEEENQAHLIEYRRETVAAFDVAGVQMICLPQVYDLFLKSLVGGLHTVYTKLKRLNISPIVCNVEQVRALRSVGAIQPGVNRCKLIGKADFDLLLDDCVSSCNRPGRPPKRQLMEEWLSPPASAKREKSDDSVEMLAAASADESAAVSSAAAALLPAFPPQLLQLGQLQLQQLLMQHMLAATSSAGPTSTTCYYEAAEREEETEISSSGEEAKPPIESLPAPLRPLNLTKTPEAARAGEMDTEGTPSGNDSEDGDCSRGGSGVSRRRMRDADSREDSANRSQSKSVSLTPVSSGRGTLAGGSPSSAADSFLSASVGKLSSLLEGTMQMISKQNDISREREDLRYRERAQRERAERAERALQLQKRRANLYFSRWRSARREAEETRQQLQALTKNVVAFS